MGSHLLGIGFRSSIARSLGWHHFHNPYRYIEDTRALLKLVVLGCNFSSSLSQEMADLTPLSTLHFYTCYVHLHYFLELSYGLCGLLFMFLFKMKIYLYFLHSKTYISIVYYFLCKCIKLFINYSYIIKWEISLHLLNMSLLYLNRKIDLIQSNKLHD